MEARIKGSNKDFQPISFIILGDNLSTCYKPKDLEFKADSCSEESSFVEWYLARDKDESLYIHFKEPEKESEAFYSTGCKYIDPDYDKFKDITFENSPVKIKIYYDTN